MVDLSRKSWPVVEAMRVLKYIGNKVPSKGYVLFETGYGPSGLPHIGTFGEVVRTSFVCFAFKQIAPDIPVKLLVVSDDFDGMRKVPDNVPNERMLKEHIGRPLIDIPSPFGDSGTYGEYMNKKLCDFLDRFDFEYTFLSSSKAYRDGMFDERLVVAAEQYKNLMDIMLPTLGAERQKTYSPFLPVDPSNGCLLTSGVIGVDPIERVIKFYDSNGEIQETKFTSGGCKLQWKCDFGMRWAALDVDYEIYGKDHYPNEPIYKSICSVLGGRPPVNFFYELFLDIDSNKISKSKGNGVSIEEWLEYSNKDVLSLYMFQKPRTAKKLSTDTIPKIFDEYLLLLSDYGKFISAEEKSRSPLFFIHADVNIPDAPSIPFSLLVNLIAGCNTEDENVVWSFLAKYDDALMKGKSVLLDRMVMGAISYYKNVIADEKCYHTPLQDELKLLLLLRNELVDLQSDGDFNELSRSDLCIEIQRRVYGIANENNVDQKWWFGLLYRSLLGTKNGPRMGSFIGLYGIDKTIELLDKVASNAMPD